MFAQGIPLQQLLSPPASLHCALPPSCPQVHIQEDDSGAMHMRNLSMHRCDTEEQALNMVRCRALLALSCPAPAHHRYPSPVVSS